MSELDRQPVDEGAGRWDWEPPEGGVVPPNSRVITRTEAATFLSEVAAGRSPTGAARSAGLSRATFEWWRSIDPHFAAMWDRAKAASVEQLEESAWQRAVYGVLEPIVYQGQITGYVRRPSDRLMELLLKAERPEKYRERVDHTVTALPMTAEQLQAAREAGMRPEVEAAAALIASLPVVEGTATDT